MLLFLFVAFILLGFLVLLVLMMVCWCRYVYTVNVIPCMCSSMSLGVRRVSTTILFLSFLGAICCIIERFEIMYMQMRFAIGVQIWFRFRGRSCRGWSFLKIDGFLDTIRHDLRLHFRPRRMHN